MVDSDTETRARFKRVRSSITEDTAFEAAERLAAEDPLSASERAGATFSFVAGGDDAE